MINPFGKRVEQLEESDLDILIKEETSEGLYMEYKSDFPNHLAKIVASLANTFGGWIIIGADARNPRNVPTSFPGIDISGEPKDRFRHICRDGIIPVPLFFSKLIIKSSDSSKGILVVRVPESSYPPHITKDGRIYRRNMEGSDPVGETDRHVLDRLFEKSILNKSEVKGFVLRKIQRSDRKVDTNEVIFKVVCCPVPLNLGLINPFFVPERITRLKKMAQSIWKQSLPKDTKFNPEGFSFQLGNHSLEILRSGVITYSYPVPTSIKDLSRATDPFQMEFLDYRALQIALLRTIKLTREVYRFTGYMGLLVIKVALENIQGRGLDDPKFFNFYLNTPEPHCTYNDIVLPYGFNPVEARVMENPRQVADSLLGYIYRTFGFEALDTHSITRAELAR